MFDPIRWLDDRDAGPLLSKFIFWIVGAALVVLFAVDGANKLINGPTTIDHVTGALGAALLIVWAIRGFMGWRSRHAR